MLISWSILTFQGREQAELTGRRLASLGLKFDQIIHSSMTRATETTEIISKYLPGKWLLLIFQHLLILKTASSKILSLSLRCSWAVISQLLYLGEYVYKETNTPNSAGFQFIFKKYKWELPLWVTGRCLYMFLSDNSPGYSSLRHFVKQGLLQVVRVVSGGNSEGEKRALNSSFCSDVRWISWQAFIVCWAIPTCRGRCGLLKGDTYFCSLCEWLLCLQGFGMLCAFFFFLPLRHTRI